jgi:succinoglycan biosynthesis transport protein ExoP
VENRRLSAVAGLQKATDDIATRLTDLQNRIAQLDRQIGDGTTPTIGTTAATSSTPQGPTNPTSAAAPTQADGAAQQNLDLGGQPTTVESLKAARYAAAVQYESLFSRQQDLLVEQNLKRGEAEVIQLASTPKAPISPKPKRDAALGGFVGLLLGVGIVFLREQLDDRARTKEEIEHATGLPVIAGLPIDEASLRDPGHRANQDSPHSALAEAVRSLRTSVQFLALGDDKVRRIVVTSSAPAEGKTLVAANLATAYAQAGFVTVLVSADLRRPRIESMFGIERGAVGLSNLVAQLPGDERPGTMNGSKPSRSSKARTSVDVETAPREVRESAITTSLVSTSTPNLFVLPAGTPPPNPAELLGSRRASEVLDELAASADIVIIDTPPVLAVTDAAVLAARADGVLLVAALGQTHRGAARQAKETLEATAARLLGVVINKTEGQTGSYYGYYGYYGDAPPSGRRWRFLRRDSVRVAASAGQVDPALTPGGQAPKR